MHGNGCLQKTEAWDPSGAGVAADWKLPNVCAGNRTGVLSNSSPLTAEPPPLAPETFLSGSSCSWLLECGFRKSTENIHTRLKSIQLRNSSLIIHNTGESFTLFLDLLRSSHLNAPQWTDHSQTSPPKQTPALASPLSARLQLTCERLHMVFTQEPPNERIQDWRRLGFLKFSPVPTDLYQHTTSALTMSNILISHTFLLCIPKLVLLSQWQVFFKFYTVINVNEIIFILSKLEVIL